ncbi:MAG TPA: PIG-L family deacetylase [Elusimicrobiales bacterium]|nr:PIG-L family deacetylase [Elusimicrobiales bacterium]
MNKILVVAVHPDDETLGCGGTLLKHIEAGDEVHWLIVTAMKKGKSFSAGDVSRRKKEIARVSGLYGFHAVHELGIETTKVDSLPMADLVSGISAVIGKVAPAVLYLPFMADPHSDHRAVFQTAYSCVKKFRYPCVRRVLMMETPSETEFAPAVQHASFTPNYFVDISGYLKKKLEIMRIFKTELGVHPFPRSERHIEALAVVRGAAADCEYAEAFMLLKEVA